MAVTGQFQSELVIRIRNELEPLIGSKMRFRANLGRCKVLEKEGVLEEIHPNVFIMKVEEKRNRMRRISYSYADILTKSVELTNIRTKKNILSWLAETKK